MPSVRAMMPIKKTMDIAWSLMLARPPDFVRSLYPRPVYQVVPLVRPAYVEVHDDPGQRERRERVDVRQRERADHLHVQHRRERRQERQPEVEDHEEDRRRYDECSLAPHQFLEGRGSFHANPLVVALHPAPFGSYPNRLGTIWDALYTVKRIRLRVRNRLSRGKKEPPGSKARGGSGGASIAVSLRPGTLGLRGGGFRA